MTEEQMVDLVERFNATWNDHDLEAALDLCTPDFVFDSTGPPPDGVCSEGRAAVAAAWAPVFADEAARFTVEESFVAGDRYVQRWRYDWHDGHVRGVDLFRIRDGKVAEKLSYVKG